MTDRDLIPSYWFARTDEEGAGPTYVVGRGDEEITYPCLFRHEAEAIVNALRDRLAQPEFDSALQSAAMTQTAPKLAQPEPVGEIVQAFADLTAVSIPVMPPVGTKLYTAPLDRMAENARELGLDYEPVQEPVAWKNAAMRIGEELSSVGPDGYYNMTAEQWLHWAMDQQPRGKNSLTAPPRRQPLPSHEIVTVYEECPTSDSDMIAFARAIEAAHGIGGEA